MTKLSNKLVEMQPQEKNTTLHHDSEMLAMIVLPILSPHKIKEKLKKYWFLDRRMGSVTRTRSM